MRAMTWVDDGCNVSNGIHDLQQIMISLAGWPGIDFDVSLFPEDDRALLNQALFGAGEAAWRTGNY